MKPEVLCFGEPLAAFYSKDRRSLSKAGEFEMTWGGDTSNVALGISKLDHTSGYITKVGDDAFGEGKGYLNASLWWQITDFFRIDLLLLDVLGNGDYNSSFGRGIRVTFNDNLRKGGK